MTLFFRNSFRRLVFLMCINFLNSLHCFADSKLPFKQSNFPSKGEIDYSYPRLTVNKQFTFLNNAYFSNVWDNKFKLRILDVNCIDGGLTPIKIGGGAQTRSLRFQSKNGRVFKFRLLQKDSPRDLAKFFNSIGAISSLNDSYKSFFPFSAVLVRSLSDIVEIPHNFPVITTLPEDLEIEKFGKQFIQVPGEFILHPKGNKSYEYFDCDKIKGTRSLLQRFRSGKYLEGWDSRAYLKARILDVLINDWDRHSRQWKWGRKNNKWFPIPQDRDCAFFNIGQSPLKSIYELYQSNSISIDPLINKKILSPICFFDLKLPPFRKLMSKSIQLDSYILAKFDWRSWKDVIDEFKDLLTENKISEAFSVLPKSINRAIKPSFLKILISRKNQLNSFFLEYFNFLEQEPKIYLSNKDEVIKINRISDHEVLVEVTQQKRNNYKVIFSKKFNSKNSHKIHIWPFNGVNKLIVTSNKKLPIKILINITSKDQISVKDNASIYDYGCSISIDPKNNLPLSPNNL